MPAGHSEFTSALFPMPLVSSQVQLSLIDSFPGHSQFTSAQCPMNETEVRNTNTNRGGQETPYQTAQPQAQSSDFPDCDSLYETLLRNARDVSSTHFIRLPVGTLLTNNRVQLSALNTAWNFAFQEKFIYIFPRRFIERFIKREIQLPYFQYPSQTDLEAGN